MPSNDYDFDPDSIEPDVKPLQLGETIAAEGATVGECIKNFVTRAIPYIRSELKRQKLINPKKRSHFQTNSALSDQSGSRVELQIVCEMFNPVLHMELYLKEIEIIEIHLPALEDTIWLAVNSVIESVGENKAYQLAQMQVIDANADAAKVIAGSRRVFKIINTGHIMQIVFVIFPEIMPLQGDNLLNHFFRSSPPMNPANN